MSPVDSVDVDGDVDVHVVVNVNGCFGQAGFAHQETENPRRQTSVRSKVNRHVRPDALDFDLWV